MPSTHATVISSPLSPVGTDGASVLEYTTSATTPTAKLVANGPGLATNLRADVGAAAWLRAVALDELFERGRSRWPFVGFAEAAAPCEAECIAGLWLKGAGDRPRVLQDDIRLDSDAWYDTRDHVRRALF